MAVNTRRRYTFQTLYCIYIWRSIFSSSNHIGIKNPKENITYSFFHIYIVSRLLFYLQINVSFPTEESISSPFITFQTVPGFTTTNLDKVLAP